MGVHVPRDPYKMEANLKMAWKMVICAAYNDHSERISG